MPYYFVNFTVTLDGSSTQYGMIRVSGPAYSQERTKNAIEKYYRDQCPSKTHVAVVINSKEEVSREVYDSAAKDSIGVVSYGDVV